MLKVFIHSGSLESRTANNILATVDIAYAKRSHFADYIVAMFINGQGEVQPGAIAGYPRWSGSLWDLVARALTCILFRSDTVPHDANVDRRCAYATRMCVSVQRSTMGDEGWELATAEITHAEKRGSYTVKLDEDILGARSATFTYGKKSLQHADLVLRAICWALYGRDTLGKRPTLILPPTMTVDGIDRFDVEALAEPAKTGFNRFRSPAGSALPPDPMPKAEDYVRFLMQG